MRSGPGRSGAVGTPAATGIRRHRPPSPGPAGGPRRRRGPAAARRLPGPRAGRRHGGPGGPRPMVSPAHGATVTGVSAGPNPGAESDQRRH
jgi:hypothetical protein